jgi:hypothetical protein
MSDNRIIERRTSTRSRQLKGGTIVFNGAQSVLSCTVRNISQGGVCLAVPSALVAPAAFELSAGGQRRRCAVVWRQTDRVGARYR